jgi:hypothetical protein
MGFIMNIHFKRDSRENALLSDSIESCNAALALINERTGLFTLLRAYSISEESSDAFNSIIDRLRHLELISHQIQLSFREVAALNDGPPRVNSVRQHRGRAYAMNERNAALRRSSEVAISSDNRDLKTRHQADGGLTLSG